jgi:predicted nucleotidyltransferase component of viral defense system
MSISRIVKHMWNAKQYIEIFHLTFLRHLESKLDKTLFALKGGCNLRFFFKSIRYSEDMDFDIRVIAKHTLQNKINKVLASDALLQTLRSKGLEILTVSEPKQTETTQRWKISLRGVGLSLPLPTKIEFSRRNMTEQVAFEPVDNDLIRTYQLYPIIANHYVAQAAFNQKINALIHRSETQARDIFDLKLLLDLRVDPKKLPTALKNKLSTAIENAMNIGFSEFKAQVQAYLLEEYQHYYNSAEIWYNTQQTVITALEPIQS